MLLAIRVGQCEFRRFISIKERESAFTPHTRSGKRSVRARGIHVVTRPRPVSRRTGMGRKRWRRSREWSVAGTACIHCQDNGFQEVYGGCARARVHDRQGEAHQFPIQFARPVFRTLSHLPIYSSCSTHTAIRKDRFRVDIGIPLARSSGLRSAFSRSTLDVRLSDSPSRVTALASTSFIFNGYNVT